MNFQFNQNKLYKNKLYKQKILKTHNESFDFFSKNIPDKKSTNNYEIIYFVGFLCISVSIISFLCQKDKSKKSQI